MAVIINSGEHGMGAKGRRHHNAKLTAEDVTLARQVYEDGLALKERLAGMSIRGLAEKFEVSKQTMDDAINYRTWRDVP